MTPTTTSREILESTKLSNLYHDYITTRHHLLSSESRDYYDPAPLRSPITTYLVRNRKAPTAYARRVISLWDRMDDYWVGRPLTRSESSGTVDSSSHALEEEQQGLASRNGQDGEGDPLSSSDRLNRDLLWAPKPTSGPETSNRNRSGSLRRFLLFICSELRRCRPIDERILACFPKTGREVRVASGEDSTSAGSKSEYTSNSRSNVPKHPSRNGSGATSLTLLLPPFILQRHLRKKVHTFPDYLLFARTLCKLIETGAYRIEEQAEILTALVRGAGRWEGGGVVLKNLGEKFLDEAVFKVNTLVRSSEATSDDPKGMTEGEGEGEGEGDGQRDMNVKTTTRKRDFEPMILALVSLLHYPASTSPGVNPNELDDPARQLLGRILQIMSERAGWRPGMMGLLLDERVISGKARDAIWRWLHQQRQTLADIDGDQNRDRHQEQEFWFRKTEVERWMHRHVQDALFVHVYERDGVEGEWLRFREEDHLQALAMGKTTARMSEILFRSALRDEEFEYARTNFRVSNEIGMQARSEAVSADEPNPSSVNSQVRDLSRALAMAGMSKNKIISQDLVGVVERTAKNATDANLYQLRSRAWVGLLGKYGLSRDIHNREWLEICAQVPPELYDDRGILTTQLGYHRIRNLPDMAWRCWQRLADSKRLDAAIVTLGAKLKFAESGPEEAIAFVDDWAVRRDKQQDEDALRVHVDYATVNALLNIARRSIRPDLATWLWQNMKSRWGVEPDDLSLARLIRCADAAHLNRIHALGLNRWEQYPELPEVMQESPTSERFAVGATLEWQDVAGIFRDIALRTYPSLRSVISPMEDGRIVNAFRELVSSGHLPTKPVEDHHAPVQQGLISKRFLPTASPLPVINLTSGSFHAYIAMLLHQRLPDEAVLALGWMKHLSIYPSRPTLMAVLRYLAESGQPKDVRFLKEREGWGRYRLMAPDEWLRHWLEQWLGPTQTPSDDEVAEFVRVRLNRS